MPRISKTQYPSNVYSFYQTLEGGECKNLMKCVNLVRCEEFAGSTRFYMPSGNFNN